MATASNVSTDSTDAPAPDVAAYRYWAFISYSHADVAWASKLHARLETWPVPRKLIGRQTPLGVVPRRLFPIFRDRDELSGASNLDDVLKAALKQSRYLIVVCSPRSAASKYVNEEIRFFKAAGRNARMIYVVIDGEPGAGDSIEGGGCFPPLSLRPVGPDGTCLEGRVEPMAVDARRGKDGPRDALLKVKALLLNVGFDELKRRDQRRRRRARNFGAAIAFAVTLVAAAAYVAVADAGWRVPAGEAIRARLDRHEASVFRHVPDDQQIRFKAAALSADLHAVLLTRRQADGRINDPPPGTPPSFSVMSHAQGMSGLLCQADESPAEFSANVASLELLFRPDLFLQRDGVKWGWYANDANDDQKQINAFMPLWIAVALSEALQRLDAHSDPALRERLLHDLNDTQETLRLFHRDAGHGAWCPFPFPTDPARHSVYVAALALLALNEAHRANVPWDGSIDGRNRLARATAQWIISQYHTTGRHGWLNDPFEEHVSDIFDGMTAETYAALLDAEQTVPGVVLPDALHEDMHDYLTACAQRGLDYPVDVGEFNLEYRHIDGAVRYDKESMRYLWWPWAIRSAELWLRYAASHNLPREQQVQVRRALAHMVIDLGPQQVKQTATDYAYVLSESLYGLAVPAARP